MPCYEDIGLICLCSVIQLFFAFQRIQVVALGCLKLSFLFFYRRLFCSAGTQRGWFHWTTLISIVIIAAWTIAFFFSFLFSCGTNFAAQWGSLLENEMECVVDQPKVEMAFSITDMIEDVFILFLPVPQVGILAPLDSSSSSSYSRPPPPAAMNTEMMISLLTRIRRFWPFKFHHRRSWQFVAFSHLD